MMKQACFALMLLFLVNGASHPYDGSRPQNEVHPTPHHREGFKSESEENNQHPSFSSRPTGFLPFRPNFAHPSVIHSRHPHKDQPEFEEHGRDVIRPGISHPFHTLPTRRIRSSHTHRTRNTRSITNTPVTNQSTTAAPTPSEEPETEGRVVEVSETEGIIMEVLEIESSKLDEDESNQNSSSEKTNSEEHKKDKENKKDKEDKKDKRPSDKSDYRGGNKANNSGSNSSEDN